MNYYAKTNKHVKNFTSEISKSIINCINSRINLYCYNSPRVGPAYTEILVDEYKLEYKKTEQLLAVYLPGVQYSLESKENINQELYSLS